MKISKTLSTCILSFFCCSGMIVHANEQQQGVRQETLSPGNGNVNVHRFQVENTQVHFSPKSTTLQIDSLNAVSIQKPTIFSKTPNGMIVNIEGTMNTPEGKREFSSILTTNLEPISQNTRIGKIENRSSFTGETFTYNFRVEYGASKTALRINFDAPMGISCNFVRAESGVWTVEKAERSNWNVKKIDNKDGVPTYLIVDDKKIKHVCIQGKGNDAIFYITTEKGHVYALPSQSFGL